MSVRNRTMRDVAIVILGLTLVGTNVILRRALQRTQQLEQLLLQAPQTCVPCPRHSEEPRPPLRVPTVGGSPLPASLLLIRMERPARSSCARMRDVLHHGRLRPRDGSMPDEEKAGRGITGGLLQAARGVFGAGSVRMRRRLEGGCVA